MKPSLLYKISSGLLILFSLSHTYGMYHPVSKGTAVDMVSAAMRTVHFDILGTSRTLWDFYFGFGLLFTVFLLFSAVLAWQLGSMVKKSPNPVRTPAWPFALSYVAVAVLCWTYFFLAPAIVSSLIAVCLVLAAWQSGRDR
jgi:hypothetical protein